MNQWTIGKKLITSFLAILWAGHVPRMFMVLGIQVRGAGCGSLEL